MASLTSSSRRSSSSYRSSSRYSTSSSYRSEGSLGGSSDSLDPLFEPFLDSADHTGLFGEEGPGGPSCLSPFSRHSRSSYGHTGGAVTGRQSSTGGPVHPLGDSYYMSANVSQYEPHDIVVMAYNHHVVIHAQKVLDDGSISDTFTHKSLFPEDMDPLSVSGSLNPDGTLVVSVRRTAAPAVLEPLGVPTYRSEAHL
ncbi:heat shock protein beta-7-like isoform X2 [Acanthopagrus latus]|uniref:heat shock protein beta-7-like isoform X2 n=1 Tax=Acanthopagrus latus TaxID=8177 RepID=UPI00187CA241|nr:heat shock protein beta-7-like isoform X2 [Acanthopagrus latus]